MVTGGNVSLTNSEIAALATEMEITVMESIAIAHLGTGVENVNNLKLMRQGDYMGFIRDLLSLSGGTRILGPTRAR